jgi:hypothetical protein
VIETPGGLESFFAVAERNLKVPQDLDAINEVAAAYGMTHTGPPLEAD